MTSESITDRWFIARDSEFNRKKFVGIHNYNVHAPLIYGYTHEEVKDKIREYEDDNNHRGPED